MIYISKAALHSNSIKLKWQECLADFLEYDTWLIMVVQFQYLDKGEIQRDIRNNLFFSLFQPLPLQHSLLYLNLIHVNIIGYY